MVLSVSIWRKGDDGEWRICLSLAEQTQNDFIAVLK